jgi:hypothetical protein
MLGGTEMLSESNRYSSETSLFKSCAERDDLKLSESASYPGR